MGMSVVVGAGPIGDGVARQLLAHGEQVVVVTRSGRGPEGAQRQALDVARAEALVPVCEGADAIYNCANPPYERWVQEWPPMAASMLAAAEASGAVLVTASNLYGYGPVPSGRMAEDLPLAATGKKGRVRAQMWQEARAAHEAGRVRAVEVRGSDYVGPGATSHLERVLPTVLQGGKARVVGDPDAPHSWTYTEDMAAALVAVATAPEAWGRPWHAPVAATKSQREALTDLARAAGLDSADVAALPGWQLRAAGWFSPMVKELQETLYQFDAPFVCDDSAIRRELGLRPTSWGEVVRTSVAAAQVA
ncbi:MAG: NAD-dependent epimerase/dehydratase family protein [Actinobacteria bacterium]|nr:MAG: NAD-dependent epimerase/dehydratase family protein [Actinomycetota bacterium]